MNSHPDSISEIVMKHTNIKAGSPSSDHASWLIPEDGRELVLTVEGKTHASITRWVDTKSGEHAWWAVERFSDNKGLGLFSHLSEACAAVCIDAGITLAPPRELIQEWHENLSQATPAVTEAATSLTDRMGDLLDDIFHADLLKLRDPASERDVELKIASFRPDLSKRICELLEEAGR